VVMRVTGGNKKVIHPTPGWIQTQDLSGCCLRTISQTRFSSSNLPSKLNSENYFSASLNWGIIRSRVTSDNESHTQISMLWTGFKPMFPVFV
jgi:hypothetical protein